MIFQTNLLVLKKHGRVMSKDSCLAGVINLTCMALLVTIAWPLVG